MHNAVIISFVLSYHITLQKMLESGCGDVQRRQRLFLRNGPPQVGILTDAYELTFLPYSHYNGAGSWLILRSERNDIVQLVPLGIRSM